MGRETQLLKKYYSYSYSIISAFQGMGMEGSKLPNREYPYYFIKLGKLYYVYHSYKNVKNKEVSSYEFTNDESLAFPIDEESAKQLADKCGGYIVMNNATFNDYISQGERWGNFIDSKKKNTWRIYIIN